MTPKMINDFSDEERAVIYERSTGWEKASAKTLALIFYTTPQVIHSIVRKMPPTPTAADPGEVDA